MVRIVRDDSALAAAQMAGAGAGAEEAPTRRASVGLLARILENKDLMSHLVQYLDPESILELGGVSMDARRAAVKESYSIQVTAKILDQINDALKGERSDLPSFLDSQNMILDLKKASKAEIILLKVVLQSHPKFANRIMSLDFSDNQALSKDLLAGILGCTKQLKMLNLYDTGLTALPPELGQLENLTSLNVSYNRLTALPPELGQLVALTDLNASRNQLTALPPELGQLVALTSFHASCNQLTILPAWFGQLENLTDFDASRNQLTALPKELGQLAALMGLSVYGNQLTALPPELGQLAALTKFDTSNNQLTALPPELGQLAALTHFDTSQNQLTALPKELGQLAALMGLSVYGNQLGVLPAELRRLPIRSDLPLRYSDDVSSARCLPPSCVIS